MVFYRNTLYLVCSIVLLGSIVKPGLTRSFVLQDALDENELEAPAGNELKEVENEINQNGVETAVKTFGQDWEAPVIDLSHLGEKAFGDPDEKVGKVLESWNSSSNINPEEMGSYLEGDILIPRALGRSALSDRSRRWPGGVVPYVISGSFSEYFKGRSKLQSLSF